MRRLNASLAAALLLLAGCQTAKPPPPAGRPDNRAAVRLLQAINDEARRCWRGDRAFQAHRITPELDTHYGKPRILLVIEAEGTPARLNTYGPLAGGELADRIGADLARWSRGGTGCGAPRQA
jgi:hypothetical protein